MRNSNLISVKYRIHRTTKLHFCFFVKNSITLFEVSETLYTVSLQLIS
jgi:hypothetical protein